MNTQRATAENLHLVAAFAAAGLLSMAGPPYAWSDDAAAKSQASEARASSTGDAAIESAGQAADDNSPEARALVPDDNKGGDGTKAAPNAAPKPKSLDAQLLDDLDDSLFDGLGGLPPIGQEKRASDAGPRAGSTDRVPADEPSATGRRNPTDDSGSQAIDEALRRQLPAGEDLGQDGSHDPLSDISERMRVVERLIGDQVTTDTTLQMQREIVDDLARLIEQLQKKGASGSSSANSNSTASSQPSSPSSQASSTGAQESSRPASESVARLDEGAVEKERLAEMKRMLDEVWGHLPPRVREQLQTGAVDRFLPRYEDLIEAYYKRLAERP